MPVLANLGNDPQLEEERLWTEFCERQTTLRKQYGDLFQSIDARWHEAASRKNFSELEEVKKLTRVLNENNYANTMRILLKMDEAHNAIEMRRYDLIKHKLEIKTIKTQMGPIKHFRVEGLADGQPQLVGGDHVIMHNQSGLSKKFKIDKITDDWILIPEQLARGKKFLNGELNLFFVSSGILYNFYERALKQFNKDEITKCRIFNCSPPNRPDFEAIRSEPKAKKRLSKLDEYQKQAVNMILTAKQYPKPYIVYGPPGTGKSRTLAEAIVQIYFCKPGCRILTCANSNACADQMLGRLKAIEIIPKDDIVRLSAGQKASVIRTARIVVTTNMKSASFIGEFRQKDLFDYVIIDEAGRPHEPEMLIPISCLKDSGCLVLAGDPNQLGPVARCDETKCNHTRKYGLDRSMMSRLFKFSSYKRHKHTKEYNCKYITKLLINYRSDRRVFAISNERFYGGRLKCPNDTPELFLKHMGITNPLQLLFVPGQERQPACSTSWCNDMEAVKCVDLILSLYKMGIRPDQVGVISPYKLQARRIGKDLQDRLEPLCPLLERLPRQLEYLAQAKSGNLSAAKLTGSDVERSNLSRQNGNSNIRVLSCEPVGEEIEKKWLCKIDSVDAYQGDERDIIIISTVRTQSVRGKKFIDEPGRFNVAMSRARWMTIVIGHKEVLSELELWSEFIRRSSEEMRFQPKE